MEAVSQLVREKLPLEVRISETQVRILVCVCWFVWVFLWVFFFPTCIPLDRNKIQVSQIIVLYCMKLDKPSV